MDIGSIVGTVAAMASVASFAPQAWKTIKARDTKGLSAAMYGLTVLAFALWLTFGIIKSEWALIVPNGLCLALSLFILMMILLPPEKKVAVAEKIDPQSS